MTFKNLALQAVLVSSFVLTACGGDSGKVYPSGSGPNKQEDDNRRRKNGGAKSKYITSHLAGTVSVAVFTLHRAMDIALNKETAQSLVKERDCQKLAVTDGSIVVTTNVSNCRRNRSASDWGGNEQLDFVAGSNGLFTSLKTTSRTYTYTLATNRHVHELEADISVRKSSNSRPGNTVTYDFDETLVIRSNGEVSSNSMDESRRKTDDDRDDERRDRRDVAPKNYEGRIDVIISGQIEVDSTTKMVTGISFKSATVDGQRTVRSGRSSPMELKTYLELKPLSAEFSPMSDGRMSADFSGTQTIEATNSNGREAPKVEYRAEVQIEPRSVTVKETRPMNLAAPKPGFETVLGDLETIIQQFFRTLAN